MILMVIMSKKISTFQIQMYFRIKYTNIISRNISLISASKSIFNYSYYAAQQLRKNHLGYFIYFLLY